MTIEGDLSVRLAWDGVRVRNATVRSTRPLAARVLAGRDIDEAAAMVPLLFSICAQAQGTAASGALGAAGGRPAVAGTLVARRLAIALETIQEYLRRLLIDMPAMQGLEPQVAPVAAARKAIAPMVTMLSPATRSIAGSVAMPGPEQLRSLGEALAGLCSAHVLALSPEAWLGQTDVATLREWAACEETLPARMLNAWLEDDAELGASDIGAMPAAERSRLERTVLAALADDPGYVRRPEWDGQPVETGAWAKLVDHPLVASCTASFRNSVVTRVVARLTDLAQLVESLVPGKDSIAASDAWAPADGEGVSAVHTARGLLVHHARVGSGRIEDYAIVAPTEWNFHPDGALVRGLKRLADHSEASLERRAALVVQALDPCVACTIEVAHA